MAKTLDHLRKQLGQRLEVSKLNTHLPTGPDLRSFNPSQPNQLVGIVQSYRPADLAGLLKVAESHAEEGKIGPWRNGSP